MRERKNMSAAERNWYRNVFLPEWKAEQEYDQKLKAEQREAAEKQPAWSVCRTERGWFWATWTKREDGKPNDWGYASTESEARGVARSKVKWVWTELTPYSAGQAYEYAKRQSKPR